MIVSSVAFRCAPVSVRRQIMKFCGLLVILIVRSVISACGHFKRLLVYQLIQHEKDQSKIPNAVRRIKAETDCKP